MPDTFDDDPRPEAESTEGSAPVTTETDPGSTDDADFDIDLDFGGPTTAASSSDDIDLDFAGGTTPAEAEADDIDLDFGAAAEADDDEDDEAADGEEDLGAAALESFRGELRAKFGDWYVIHTYSGMENRVQQNLENRVSSLNMEDYIFEIVVPTEEVTEKIGRAHV